MEQIDPTDIQPLLGTGERPDIKLTELSILDRHQTKFKILVFFLFLLYCGALVAVATTLSQYYFYLGFVIAFNAIVLYFTGTYLLRGIMYPYSNYFIRKYLDSILNKKYAEEFSALLAQMMENVKLMAKMQQDISLDGTGGADIRTQPQNAISPPSGFQGPVILEINSKMMTVFELIHLYIQINEDIIIGKLEKTNKYFVNITSTLKKIRTLLMGFKISEYQEIDDPVKGQTLWDIYRKDTMTETDIDNLISSRVLPDLTSVVDHQEMIKQLEIQVNIFKRQVKAATGKKCFCLYKKLFGTVQQNMILLKKNFEGQHFMIESYNGTKIDCMFFPCTSEEGINTEFPTGDYLDKPNFIMCSPNALMYQQMVSTPNAYWLNFFLKREINVMCWNYRGYGQSQSKWWQGINPYICKLDAERVLQFMVNKMNLKGKIGVYGRSIGGIPSCHLGNKFPNLISALIVDRSFCELDKLSEHRLKGGCTKNLFKIISCQWKALNDANFSKAKCFKIGTCDPKDDVVDNNSNLAVGVAYHQAKTQYNNQRWKKFYQSLMVIHDLDDLYYNKIYQSTEPGLVQQMIKFPQVDEEQFTQINEQYLEGSGMSGASSNASLQHLSNIMPNINLEQLNYNLIGIKQCSQMYLIIHPIIVMVQDFQPGNFKMQDILSYNKKRNFTEFISLLQVLEIYGCGYWDDIDRFKYRERSNSSHQQTALKDLVQIIDVYLLVIKQLIDKDHTLLGIPQNIKTSLIQLLRFQLCMWQTLQDIQIKRQNDSDFQSQEQGHLVMMNCGHRGKPNRPEEKRISRLLRKSGFIPMLDELVQHNPLHNNNASQNRNNTSQNKNQLGIHVDDLLVNNENASQVANMSQSHIRPLDKLESIHRSKLQNSLKHSQLAGGNSNNVSVALREAPEAIDNVLEEVKSKLHLKD